MADRSTWELVPFPFWTATAFLFGCIVGSFLNVCIHRLPRGESIVHPPSHCPHCGYSIPWYLNIPLITWLWLGGKCAHCKAGISARYFLVELLTGAAFAACWIKFSPVSGHLSPVLPLAYCLMISGLIAATFIDFEHLIIPDQFTFGGMVAGLFISFLVPAMHLSLSPGFPRFTSPGAALRDSIVGMAVGAGLIYAIVRLGKLFLGRYKINLPPGSRVVFTETAVVLPDGECPYEDLFYRKSDAIEMQASHVELIDRCHVAAAVRLTADRLEVGGDTYAPEKVPWLEATAEWIVLPREAMGPADVTFMAAIGAFLGWPAVIFSFMASCFLGSLVGCTLIFLDKKDWSSRIPYGPYIAVGAVIWMFGGYHWLPLVLPLR
jgi:leader peptidase (prepilin peptidase)/N-methyltransferase